MKTDQPKPTKTRTEKEKMARRFTKNHEGRAWQYDPTPLVGAEEVPAKVLQEQFDYQDAEDSRYGFFRVGPFWHHLDQVMRIPPTPDGFCGSIGESNASGLLIKFCDADGYDYDEDHVIVRRVTT